MKMEGVLKRRPLKLRCRGITQKGTHKIFNITVFCEELDIDYAACLRNPVNVLGS